MALYNYGNKIKQQEQIDKLMEEKRKDSNPEIYLYIRDSNYDYGEQYNNALECLDKALEINSDHSVVWYNKGYILYSFKEDEDALECFGKALENNPSYIEAWNMKGNVLNSMGEGEGAKECYTRAEKLKEEKDKQK